MASLTCPRCGGSMRAGFLVDKGHYSEPGVQQWMAGEPERSLTGLKTNDRERFAVTTYRCERCGLLESYAKGDSA